MARRITALNVNSITTAARKILLLDFINENNPDILLLSETHLKENRQFKISNYNIIRGDRINNNGGGTAIIFKNGLQFKNFRHEINDTFEAVLVDSCLNSSWVTIISFYGLPKPSIHLELISNFFENLNNNFICGGDFNARLPNMDNISVNTSGSFFDNLIKNNPNIGAIFPRNPTCYRSTHGSIIDFFIFSSSKFK